VSVGRRGVVLIGAANPLVSRGLAALAHGGPFAGPEATHFVLEEALSCYERGRALLEDEDWTKLEDGDCEKALREFDEAIRFFDRVNRLDATNAKALVCCGKAWCGVAEALGYTACPDDWAYEEATRRINRALGEAAKNLEKAVALEPSNAETYYQLAKVRDDMDDFDSAIEDLDAAIRLDPQNCAYVAERARIHSSFRNKQKNYSNATADFSAAIRINPKDATLYRDRACCWLRTGQYAKAITDLETAVRISVWPDSSYYNDLACLLATCPAADLRDGKRAIEMATKACELTKWKYGDTLDTLASAYAEVGQFDEAIHWQTRALETSTSRIEVVRDAFRWRLEMYKQKQPFRQAH
jgi:tetratricopeptide (TPR) repeat protein